MFVLLFLTMQTVTNSGVSRETSIFIVVPLALCQLYCITLLYLQTELFKKAAMEKEMNSLNMLYERQRQQYQVAKRNVQIINRKCHDLKHQMAALQTVIPESQRKAYCEEVQNAIQIYDSSLNTGSNVLDTILTDKSLYCEAHQISMTCVADGHRLSFLNSMDIYAIFGNALDNAIRAAAALDDPQKRFISVSVWEKNGLVLFQFENYYEGTLEFDGALPKTTKDSPSAHGYGLKSIQQTAQKYGGQMTLHTDNHLFLLRVSIPVPKEYTQRDGG